jgi:hypothetical protein
MSKGLTMSSMLWLIEVEQREAEKQVKQMSHVQQMHCVSSKINDRYQF